VIDIVDKQTRSRMMSGIRSKNTRPEILTRSALHSLGYRFRLDSKVGKITPDIVLRKHKVAIFTHGCYWHQHEDCKLAYSDRNYSEKWIKKFDDNHQRDQRVLKQLLANGWKVAVVWECSTRDSDIFGDTINQLDSWIRRKGDDYFESRYKK
jgi:DNA mismatch endonuclease (patch repair protein)